MSTTELKCDMLICAYIGGLSHYRVTSDILKFIPENQVTIHTLCEFQEKHARENNYIPEIVDSNQNKLIIQFHGLTEPEAYTALQQLGECVIIVDYTVTQATGGIQ